MLSKILPGFGEIFRMLSYQEVGSRAIASRAMAGVLEKTLVFCLPGSTKAVELAMNKLIVPELTHLNRQLRGLS
jgi:molybdenum cofactor biosynthesis protein B